ncbi:MAG TPA: nucleotidyltransferase domain-containing protein [Thermoanaerobaculia bacterium]|nr:nucleotidyltransferase domain-containing protein [Thermoanaerobaculia bacterium]
MLFGSLARNDHAPGSDADLLVVIPETAVPFRDRDRLLPDLHLPIPAQILVYTESELQHLEAEGHPLVRRALAEGRWLAGGLR